MGKDKQQRVEHYNEFRKKQNYPWWLWIKRNYISGAGDDDFRISSKYQIEILNFFHTKTKKEKSEETNIKIAQKYETLIRISHTMDQSVNPWLRHKVYITNNKITTSRKSFTYLPIQFDCGTTNLETWIRRLQKCGIERRRWLGSAWSLLKKLEINLQLRNFAFLLLFSNFAGEFQNPIRWLSELPHFLMFIILKLPR